MDYDNFEKQLKNLLKFYMQRNRFKLEIFESEYANFYAIFI